MFAFNETATGHNHIIKNTECEDFSDSISNERYYIAIVADGHGAKECFRSGLGAKFAVEITKQCLKDFAESIIISPKEKITNKTVFITPHPFSEELLCDSEYYRNQEIKRLTDTIIYRWHDEVKNHYEQYPPTKEELKDNKVEDMDINNLSEDEKFHIYGTTLIAGLMLSKCLILIQQGDGRCEVFIESDKGLQIRQPIPWDSRCEYNVTTSMCDEDVVESIRSRFINLTKKKVIACYFGSDGVEDAYRDTYEDLGSSHKKMGGVDTFYKHLSYKIVKKGEIEFKQSLKKNLSDFSENGLFSRTGSGDDVSVAGIVDIEALSKYVSQFKDDINIYKLDEELFWKGDELRGKLRKHGILKQNYLDSETAYEKAEDEYNRFVDAWEKRNRFGKPKNLNEEYRLRQRGRYLKQKCKEAAEQCLKDNKLFNDYDQTFNKIQDEIELLKQKKSDPDRNSYNSIADKNKIYNEEIQKELDETIEKLDNEIKDLDGQLERLEKEIEEERRRAEEEARRRAEEEARRKAEAERRKAEEARRKAEAEAKRKAEAERRRKEEEARRKAGQKDSGGFDSVVQRVKDLGQNLKDWGNKAVQDLQENFENLKSGVNRADCSGIVSNSAATSNIEHEHNMDLSQELEVQGVEQQIPSVDSSNDSVAGDTTPVENQVTDSPVTGQEVTEPADSVEQEDEEKFQFSGSKVIEYIAGSPSNNSEEKISIVEQSSQTGSVNNPEVIDFCESGTDNSMSPVTGKTDSEDLAKNLSDDSSNNLEIGDTVPEINESGTPVNTDIATSTNAEASEEVKETNQESTEFDESKENVEETKQEVTEPVDLTDNLEGTDSKESATYSTTSEGEEQAQDDQQQTLIGDFSANSVVKEGTLPVESIKDVEEPKREVKCSTENIDPLIIGSVDSEETDSKESTDETTTSEGGEQPQGGLQVLSDDSSNDSAGNNTPTVDESKENVTEETTLEVIEPVDLTDNLDDIVIIPNTGVTDSEESGTDETTTSESEEQPQGDQQQTLIEDFSNNSVVKETTQPVNEPKENVTEPKQEEKEFADPVDSAEVEIPTDKAEEDARKNAKKEVRNEDGSIPIEVKHTTKSNNKGETTRVVNSHYSERRISKEKYSCSVSRKFKVQLEIYPNPEFEEDDDIDDLYD